MNMSTNNLVERKRARLIDVARLANVSPMAVSQALNPRRNSSARVAKATGDRILKIAKNLNYKPNLAARQLAQQKSGIIGAVIDAQSAMYMGEALSSMEKCAATKGFRFLVGYTHDNYDQIATYADDFLGRGAEGVLCMAHTYPEFGHKVPHLFAPFRNCVFVEAPFDNSAASYATINYKRVGYMATNHLIRMGKHRIAYRMPHPGYASQEECEAGYRAAMKEAEIIYDESMLKSLDCVDLTAIDTIESADLYLTQVLPLEPEALIVGSDESAMWVMRSLDTKGMKVPHDIAVISTERLRFGQAFSPPITAIDLRPNEVAFEAIRMLIEDIHRSEDEARSIRASVVEPILVLGNSCGEESSRLYKKNQ
jgi:DNA-binding LacI/PurR family transcriptional regulator